MNDAIKVELLPAGAVVEAPAGSLLQEILAGAGVEFPCGGLGRCRGCRVRVLEGELAVSPAMKKRLTAAELAAGWRLACQAKVRGPLKLEVGQWKADVLVDDTPMPGGQKHGLGIAVDLGTTTIAAQLVDLDSGQVLGVRTSWNPQGHYGADVMSRVSFAMGDGRLTRMIRDHVGGLIGELARGVESSVGEVVLVGNTVMHHLFCGLDVEPLSHVPFRPANGREFSVPASALEWPLGASCVVRFLAAVGGFVGSDLAVGVRAIGTMRSQDLVALIDLGTNGEIALGNQDRVVAASTAAGPAFEAASIQMGMRAVEGAIHAVEARGGRLRCRTIGGGTPRGICGSGLVDAVAAGLDLGLIDARGKLAGGRTELPLAGSVSLIQRDIRELQLAKAAIAAGFRILLGRIGAKPDDVRALYLAGAFGNYVRVRSARRIGLLEVSEDRVTPAGNTALRGAKLVLLSAVDTGARAIEHVELAADPSFQDIFVDCLNFPA